MARTHKRASRGKRRAGRRRRTGRARRLLALGMAAAVIGLSSVLYVYVEVTEKFEGRLWTFPSRIYSDRLVLRPGVAIEPEALTRRLDRSGYARTADEPDVAARYRRRGGEIEIFLRAFELPDGSYPARKVSVRFSGGTVASIRDGRGARLGRVDLEPEILAMVFGPRQEEREFVRLEEIPPDLLRAVLAAEDRRFYAHRGVDMVAIARAALANVRSGRIVQGGSTITQQTVKNLYLGQERTWWRKVREILMAVVLDLRYPKDRIVEVYLNEVYLGQRGSVAICGVQAASRLYFGRDLSDLSLGETALLAGLIRNPGGYNPFRHPDRAIARRNRVLDAMAEEDSADAERIERARGEPLRVANAPGGFSSAPYVVDAVRAQLSAEYSAQDLSEQGLRIYTSIDTLWQNRTQEVLREGLERLEREVPTVRRQVGRRLLQGSVVVLEPGSGAVLAMVGGRDYRTSQFNRAMQARRQPGSCFKPFVFVAGFEQRIRGGEGLTPASIVEDEPFEMISGGQVWKPSNHDGEFRGPVTVRRILEDSLNVPTARAAQRIGLEEIVEVAERCGLAPGLRPLPSLALGAQEVTPLELATAYATLANGGRSVSPRIVREVLSRDGHALAREEPGGVQAVSAESAYLVTDILRGVMTRGTAAGVGFPGVAAGKTGTTDDTRDSWFVGYTPDVLALVWVGYDDNARSGLTGSRGALPIWAALMRDLGHGREEFPRPEGIVAAVIDPETGELAVRQCPEAVAEAFAEGTEPQQPCSVHSGNLRKWFRNLFRRRRV